MRPATPHGSARAAVRAAAVVLAGLLLVGCADPNSRPTTRNGTRAPGQDQVNVSNGQTFTQIPPDQRKPAPIVQGPALVGDGTVSTADYPGKVIVVNVWGSWCAPCRLEAADLSAASRETAPSAAFVGINVRDYDKAPAQAFVRAQQVPYPSIYDPNGEVLLEFAGTLPASGVPTTLVIDRQGRMAARIIGVVSKTSLVDLIQTTAQEG